MVSQPLTFLNEHESRQQSRMIYREKVAFAFVFRSLEIVSLIDAFCVRSLNF